MNFHNREENLIKSISVLLLTFVVYRNAWLCDDAYITFRTVYNFVNGYGLTWNIAERVQVYTNPLWMFLISGFYFITNEIYYTSIILSITITFVTAFLIAFKIAPTTSTAVVSLITLTFSKAFIDYSTSGLENPLTFFLLSLYLFVYFKHEISCKVIFFLSLIAAFGVLDRIDTVLLFIPSLAYALIKLKKKKGILASLAGLIPFILWECFSLLYYGFLIPNTAYAKLNTGINWQLLGKQGLFYIANSLKIDPLTVTVIIFSIIVTILSKDRKVISATAGVILYLLYVVRVGGDFMSSRFLVAPFLFSVIILSQSRLIINKLIWLPTLISVLLIGFLSPYPPILNTASYGKDKNLSDIRDRHGVTDERAFYYQNTGLLTDSPHKRARQWWKLKNTPVLTSASDKNGGQEMNQKVEKRWLIGMHGFYGGPEVYIVDMFCLADPLRARLPSRKDKPWMIGHFERIIPDGYLESLACGQNKIKDKKLAAYYDKLCIITRGKLFSINRLIEIWKMNTGYYDNYLSLYER